MVNRNVSNFLRRLHPHFNKARLTNPYELRRLIQSLKTKYAPGTDGISPTMLRNLSRKALIHITLLFNHILMFGYFPIVWKSAKVIPIPKPGKPPFDPCSHRPISLLSTLTKLLEQAAAKDWILLVTRITFFVRNNLASVNSIQQPLNLLESPTSSPMTLIL